MSDPKQYRLLEDIISNGRKIEVYGKRLDKVSVIAVSGEVAIVEDAKGKRFPVKLRDMEEITK